MRNYFGNPKSFCFFLEDVKKGVDNEETHLLHNGTICHNQWRSSLVELNEIAYEDNSNLSLRKVNLEAK